MKKLLLGVAASVLVATSAFCEKVGLDFSVTVGGTNPVITAITGAAGETNWSAVAFAVISVPAKARATLSFYTHSGAQEAKTGEDVRLFNVATSAVGVCVCPVVTAADDRWGTKFPIPVHGTNSYFSIRQENTGTNTWAVKLLLER